jgi:hypothetical protein
MMMTEFIRDRITTDADKDPAIEKRRCKAAPFGAAARIEKIRSARQDA